MAGNVHLYEVILFNEQHTGRQAVVEALVEIGLSTPVAEKVTADAEAIGYTPCWTGSAKNCIQVLNTLSDQAFRVVLRRVTRSAPFPRIRGLNQS